MTSCICYDLLFIDGNCRMCGGEEDPLFIQSDGELLALAERLRTFGRTSAPWTASFAIKQLMEERDHAIAHDTQTYPTAEAYELVCALLQKEKERNITLQAQLTEKQTA